MKNFTIPKDFETITLFKKGPDASQPVSFYCDYSGCAKARNFANNDFSWAAILVQGEKEWSLGGLLEPEKATQSYGEAYAIMATYRWLKTQGFREITGFSDSPGFFAHIHEHLKDADLQLKQVKGTHPTHKKAHHLCKKIKKEHQKLKNASLANPVSKPQNTKPTFFIDVILKEGCWAATIHESGKCTVSYQPLHSSIYHNLQSFMQWVAQYPQATLISSDQETLENFNHLPMAIKRGTADIPHNRKTKATFATLQEIRRKYIEQHRIPSLKEHLNPQDFTQEDWQRLEQYFEDLKQSRDQLHQQQQTLRYIGTSQFLEQIYHDLKTFFTTPAQAHILISALKESEKHSPTAPHRLSNFTSQQWLSKAPITTPLRKYPSSLLHTIYQQKNLYFNELSKTSGLHPQALQLLIRELTAYGVLRTLLIWSEETNQPSDLYIHCISPNPETPPVPKPPTTFFKARGYTD